MTANQRNNNGWRVRFGRERADVPPAPTFPPLRLREAERTLALFVAGLTNGALILAGNVEATTSGAYTNGRTIFLPEQIAYAPARAGNLRLYKALIAHTAAQHLYGTLDPAGLEPLQRATDPALLATVFEVVEGARLAAHLARDFPGIGRELRAFATEGLTVRQSLTQHRGRTQAVELLLHRSLGVEEAALAAVRGRQQPTLRAISALLPAPERWQELSRADSLTFALAVQEQIVGLSAGAKLPPLLGRGRIRLDRVRRELPPPLAAPPPRRDEGAKQPPPVELPRPAPTLVVEGRGLPPPLPNNDERRIEPQGGRQVAVSYADTAPQFTSRLVPLTAEEKRGAFTYPEWDVTIGAYRPEWVALRPRRLRTGTTEWVDGVIRRRHAQIQALKRQFETLRPERQRQRRQDDGEDLDLDVVVASHVDRKLGLSPDERPYARTREDRRDIAVALLIDLSGSTGGYIAGPRGGERVIDVAKESLVLLGEALTTLDDRYAIYGFSGSTRKGCEFYTVKEFTDQWDEETKQRLGGLAPLSYTRLGPPIRHTTMLLQAVPARVKLLMLLSDGRPNDFDAYGGEYGITDTRKALLEARGHGIRTFCLTIDAEAREYMPRLFGPDNYVTLSDVASLPRKLPDLYRRLTVG